MNINQIKRPITIEPVPVVSGHPWAIGASWIAYVEELDVSVSGCSPVQALERLLALLEKRNAD